MRKSTKAIGLIFLASLSVYSSQVIGAAPAKPGKGSASPANQATSVKLIEESPDAVADNAPATRPSSEVPATNPSASGVAPSMQANVDGTFSLNITNGADLVETLRVIGFQAQKSILPSKDVHSVLPALDLYNVTVHEALDAILKVNGFIYKEQGNFIYVYSAKEAAEIEKANRVVSTEVFRLYYTPAANVMPMIKPIMSEVGQSAMTTAAISGLDSGTKDIGGNSHATDDMIVVTDYTENLDRIRKVIKDIDHRPQQILIEATILRASLTENNALGVDFNILSGVDFASLTSSSGQITNANLGSGTIAAGGGNISSVGTGNNFTNPIAGGLKVGFLSSNVSLFVAALEGVTDTTVLANPKVLALNKQKGEVIVGRKDGYLTTTTTDTSTVQTVDFLDTGTRMIFRPYIGDDGYIRMEIHPEDSSGGLSAANLPFKVTTEVTSNIMVKDGHTVVIGGLFRESSTTGRSQIPGLGNIPVAGALFRNQADQTTREEIIILLTPHIVKDDAAFSEASEELLKHGEQMRVGVREGMMPWGRERLAESCYESAVSEMAKSNPDRNSALWHLDCAINLNPKFSEAIQMKQEITGKVITSADNSDIRNFVRKQIMLDRKVSKAEVSSAASAQPATQPSGQPSMPSASMQESMQLAMPEAMSLPSMPSMDAMPAAVEGASDYSLQPKSGEMAAVPATQPAMAESKQPSPETIDLGMSAMMQAMRSVFPMQSMGESINASPSTQPSDSSVKETTITELPTDDSSSEPEPKK